MKAKTVFFCSDCGYETPKWQGRCPSCGAWNTFVEAPAETKSKNGSALVASRTRRNPPELLSEIGTEDELRFTTGFSEFDRVLGGGAVRGSLVLVGGAPGIGKSTLLLQFCGLAESREKILYVTGEESKRQLKMRAERLGSGTERLYVLAETDLSEIISAVGDIKPDVLIVDSIQTMYNPELDASPGSVSQVKDCTMAIMQLAKSESITAFIVSHVNKEGAIAGPKVLEHMVDCVLYFEGEKSMSYRILRAAKNRFGSTNEIGVFEMADIGLKEVQNPSETLLSGRPVNCPGTCVTCVMEGSRPILAEIQALVAPSGFNVARRNSNGIDYNRATLLLAVLEKRGGISVGSSDAYINVIGGLELSEPAADLATVLAIASSQRDIPIGNDLAAVGEVGLTGEIRSVSALNQRLAEINRLGFKRCVIPAHVRDDVRAPKELELISVRNVREAITALLTGGARQMPRFVRNPNLPSGRVLTAAIGEDYAEVLSPALKSIGIEAIVCPANPLVDARLRSHIDLSVFHLGANRFIVSEAVSNSPFTDALKSLGAEVYISGTVQSSDYPHDAALCALAAGDLLFHNLGIAEKLITEMKTYSQIHVRQGYAKCAVCPVDASAAITADRGLVRAMKNEGFDVLEIASEGIELAGFENGFIGGSAFKCASDRLAFTGTLERHPDKARIEAFLERHGIKPLYITDRPLFDVGSIIPITEVD